jgi:hypothetical protein
MISSTNGITGIMIIYNGSTDNTCRRIHDRIYNVGKIHKHVKKLILNKKTKCEHFLYESTVTDVGGKIKKCDKNKQITSYNLFVKHEIF